jgi:electron transport complex protein RnfD
MTEMPVSQPRPFVVTPGPHLRVSETTASIMWWVNASLAPAAIWGVVVFGLPALAVVLSSIMGAVGAEYLANRIMKTRLTVGDGSAFCTGLLLALTLPPLVPWWAALIGGLFSVMLGKAIFGGLGYNLFNPALIGRAFMMASFPVAMTAGWARLPAWAVRPDMVMHGQTTATPLAVLKEHGLAEALRVIGGAGGWPAMLLGLRPGSIGEVSVVIVALGAAVLVARGIITLTIPLSVFAGTALVTAFSGAPWLHLMGGGLWLGAFFMATDYVTSPSTRNGQIVFGLLTGVLTGVIRLWGGYPEGICYAILIANAMVPALNLWFRPKRVALAGSPS